MDKYEQWRLVQMSHEALASSVQAKAISGHFRRDQTCSLLASKVYFPSIKTCQHVKAGSKFEKGDDQLKSTCTSQPWQAKLLKVLPSSCITLFFILEPQEIISMNGEENLSYNLVFHFGATRNHINEWGREFVNQMCVHSCLHRVKTCILSQVCSVQPRMPYFVSDQELFYNFFLLFSLHLCL